MTQNEVSIIKNAVLDATEAYVDARLGQATFVKTQIGTTVGEPRKENNKYYHTVKCNQTSSSSARTVTYNNVLSVGNTKFPPNSVVFIIAPNGQFSNQFILGQLDDTPVNIVGGTISIGGDNPYVDPNFHVDSDGNVTIKHGTLNLGGGKFKVDNDGKLTSTSGTIGGFEITNNSLGDPLGSSDAVGMISGDHLYAWSSSGGSVSTVKIYPYEVQLTNATISVDYGSSWIHISASNIQNNNLGYVVWHSELSDKRYKNNINKISSEKIQKFYNELEPYSFKFNEDVEDKDDSIHYGVVAQNLQTALNNANLDSASLVKENKEKDILLVDYQELHGLELAGIKDLYKQIDALKAQIEAK